MQDLTCEDAKRLFSEYYGAVSMAAAAARAGRAESKSYLRTAIRNRADHNRVHHYCRTMRFEGAWLSRRWTGCETWFDLT